MLRKAAIVTLQTESLMENQIINQLIKKHDANEYRKSFMFAALE